MSACLSSPWTLGRSLVIPSQRGDQVCDDTGNRATGRQRGAATGSGTPGHTRGSSTV